MLTLAWALVIPNAHANEPTPEERLQKARLEEYVEGRYHEALKQYRAVWRSDAATPALKARAVMGMARCHGHLGQDTEARDMWKAVLGQKTITDAERRIAEDELLRLDQALDAAASDEQSDAAREEALKAFREERRAEARALLEKARAAFADKAYEDARLYALLSIRVADDGNHDEQDALLAEIAQVLPDDRADLIRNLVDFFQTAQIEQYQALESEAYKLYDAGKRALRRESWREADNLFRQGIEAIDDSGLLGSASVVAGNSLALTRDRLKLWLRETHERAEAAEGLTFAPIPRAPDPRRDNPGFASQFYGLIAQAFGSRSRQEDPLRFYDLHAPRGQGRTTLSGSFEGIRGLGAASEPGTLGRARWVERWLLREFPGNWPKSRKSELMTPTSPRQASRTATRMPLIRFGDWLVVQHGEAMHGRVEGLADRFPKQGASLVVTAHVFAATTAGVVQACEALTARARRSETAHAIPLPRTTLQESLAILRKMGAGGAVEELGGVTMQLDGGPSAKMLITAETAKHPQYIGLPAPPLRISAEDARYGIFLDTYVEPLRPDDGSGDVAALSLRAHVRTPVGSVNVPFRSGDLRFTRVPRMAEQHLDADVELSMGGSFLMLGLQNPFSTETPGRDQLIVVLGVHPKGTQNPDPPRNASRITPANTRHAEFEIGPLGIEFLDHEVGMGWPRRRPALGGTLDTHLHEVRDQYLAQLIATGAGLSDPARPPEIWPVTVQRGRLSGVLSPSETTQIKRFLERLHAHENDLYEIDVVAAVVPRESAQAWGEEEGLTKDKEDWWILDRDAARRLDARLREAASPESLFTVDERVPARATQRIGLTNLSAKTVVRDLNVHPTPRGEPRYTPVLGLVEEGLIVEVRPGLRIEPGLARPVSIGVRAARLEKLERMAYPGAKIPEATIVMPTWHPTVDVLGAPILTDEQATLIRTPYPGDPSRRILVKVQVRKVR